jgi:hypothetical protein
MTLHAVRLCLARNLGVAVAEVETRVVLIMSGGTEPRLADVSGSTAQLPRGTCQAIGFHPDQTALLTRETSPRAFHVLVIQIVKAT